MIKVRINKRARMTASMLASACFIFLAIWGWDLPIPTALAFFAICVVFLVLIIGSAALLGWLLHKLRNKNVKNEE